jgi:hypothetical protein
MDTIFNSLLNDDTEISDHYKIDSVDDIGLDERIKKNPLILNFYDKDLEYLQNISKRNFSNLPVTHISPRPCATSLCSSDKFCDSAGKPEIINDISLKCDNDFIPNGTKGTISKYFSNIDIESRLFNIDYYQQNEKCSKKLKNPGLKSLNCYKDNILLRDTLINNDNSYKHDKKNNTNCDKYIEDELFNMPSKRIDTVYW